MNGDGLNLFLNMNPMEKYITERNTTSENLTYLVDKKICLSQHEKFHPLTAKRGNCISEKMYRDIKNCSTRPT